MQSVEVSCEGYRTEQRMTEKASRRAYRREAVEAFSAGKVEETPAPLQSRSQEKSTGVRKRGT